MWTSLLITVGALVVLGAGVSLLTHWATKSATNKEKARYAEKRNKARMRYEQAASQSAPDSLDDLADRYERLRLR
jgi:hypothetical protein